MSDPESPQFEVHDREVLENADPLPFAQAFLLAVGAALLAALYPAWRIGRMQVTQALRGE